MSRVVSIVLVAASSMVGCFDPGRTTRVLHPVSITTTPPNAQILRGKTSLGNAPLKIQVIEKTARTHFNPLKSWLWNLGWSLVTAGCTYGATTVGSEDDKYAGMVTCAVISGAMALLSIGVTASGHSKPERTETSIEPMFIQASAPGYAKAGRLIDKKRPSVHLTLPKALPKPPQAGGAGARPPIVAVFDVRIDGVARRAALTKQQLSELLHSRLAESGRYRLIPRSRLRRQLAEQKRESYKLCYDESCQIELGRALAAQHSLATRLMIVGKRCVFSAEFYDLATELSHEAAVVETGCGADALLAALSELVGKLAAPTPAKKR